MERERRHEKYYEEIMERIANGYVIERNLFKYQPLRDEERQVQEEMEKKWKEGVKKRFKREKQVRRESVYPKDKEMVIKCKTYNQLSKVIQVLTVLIEPEEIYMYDPLMNGSGYKYYKGERVIVYQIDKWMNQKTKKRIVDQIEKKEIKNVNNILYRIDNVYKIVIVTKTKWEYKKESRPIYEIEQGYGDMINVITHGRVDVKKVIDRRERITKCLKELIERYL